MTPTEVLDQLNNITDATSSVIGDGDTGYGNANEQKYCKMEVRINRRSTFLKDVVIHQERCCFKRRSI